MPSPHLPPLGLYSPWDNRFPRRVDIDGTRRLYDTQVVVLSQHQNWVDPRHLKTLAWMIVGLIHALAPYPHATHRYAADAIVDGLRFLCLCLRPSPALTAENLFLRKQLALYRERHVKPTRATHTTRIANELLFMLGLRLSPRTVRKSLPRCRDCCPKPGMSSQRWRTLVRNHAQVIVACDFCVAVTATLRNLYLFVVTEHATRTILHANVTGHPTAVWTLQQLRAAIPAEHACRYLIHNRDSMFSQQFDQRGRHLGLRVLKTPMRSPQTVSVQGGRAVRSRRHLEADR
jgi:hypothetical protein